jgi:5-formyltetrahydrofolate cyclo-ligase
MAERRQSLTNDERRVHAQSAAALLLSLPELAGAGVVSGYVAAKGELDPAAALAGARARGATVVLPRVAEPARLCFHVVESDAELRPGKFGLVEPDAACRELPVEEVDVMIVPGLAFDAEGRRLGWGGGYYDAAGARLLGIAVGIGYDFQVVERCPAGPGDVPVDVVVTDQRVLRPVRS